MTDFYMTALSFAFIFSVIALSMLIRQLGAHEEWSRKAAHILVGHWILAAFSGFSSVYTACIVPIFFTAFNYIALKKNLIPSFDRAGDQSFGTVWYAAALAALTILGWVVDFPPMAYAGILCMAYGDGLAAIVGKHAGRHQWHCVRTRKTYEGSVVMFAVSALTVGVVSYASGLAHPFLAAVLTGGLAAMIELFGENGCDNISVPIGVAVYLYLFSISPALEFALLSAGTTALLLASLRLGALKPDGVVAALLSGLTLYAIGHPALYIALIWFFIAGSFVSALRSKTKDEAVFLHERNGKRGWIQVICNSLPAVAAVWVSLFARNHDKAIFVGFVVFAAAMADTFGSELGMMTGGKTFSILTWKTLPRGLSGGVSTAGLAASAAGAFLAALPALYLFPLRAVISIAGFGMIGSLLDSVLGAALQVKYISPEGRLTEKRFAYSGSDALPVYSGFSLINNDIVNILSLALSAGIAAFVA